MSKFTSFLKKAGQVIAAIAQGFIQEEPLLAGLVPLLPQKVQATATADLNTIGTDANLLNQAIFSAEDVGNAIGSGTLTGPQKAQIAGSDFAKIFLSTTAFAGKKIANPQAFAQAMTTMAGALADAWNTVDGSGLPNFPQLTPMPAPVQSPAAATNAAAAASPTPAAPTATFPAPAAPAPPAPVATPGAPVPSGS